MENKLTERDLLVLTACTSTMFTRDFGKVHEFVEKTLNRPVQTAAFALQETYDECKEKLKDEYFAVVEKMIKQAEVV